MDLGCSLWGILARYLSSVFPCNQRNVTGDILGSPGVTRLFQFGKLENTVAWDLMNLFMSGSGSESYPLLSRGPPLLFSRCE